MVNTINWEHRTRVPTAPKCTEFVRLWGPQKSGLKWVGNGRRCARGRLGNIWMFRTSAQRRLMRFQAMLTFWIVVFHQGGTVSIYRAIPHLNLGQKWILSEGIEAPKIWWILILFKIKHGVCLYPRNMCFRLVRFLKMEHFGILTLAFRTWNGVLKNGFNPI